MTKEQRAAIAVAQELAERLHRRPTGADLRRVGVYCGTSFPFQRLHDLLVAAKLALPAPDHLAGFTEAEERVLLRLWEARETTRAMAKALGVMNRVMANEVATRQLKRAPIRGRHPEPVIALRRCQAPHCGQLTDGMGACRHCGADGLTSAA
jgi:hypothetical protein